ncbi:lactate dehydrogenase [Erwinia sp. OLTSP20]|uniref:2-hydroxyacid dehydrogenase n=1 Tax=unclassified Erwinia TaxID=2622719 RepID=UPI000C17417D|nr:MULTISPECIES: 2-hydroxyacid dehydrogenase [unclassified Erwinia]PIJ50270.1 lactate dehydrogenase [Erwinia sp. OAMSP11]PIJ72108.1 lactate dehydrogenase [Erwinia sp. OLSSP12]PIJ81399.1 lactate dehydrogenase [Erwinia sp. OLCASP19]PIJ84105.1 lactate dehydrogenase [Erwinia sp. OLMTSP26]PIJ85804.1 lactate dehydrogenase [Erwinia sp. OLMDSP33]
MKVLIGAEETAWGGMIQQFRQTLPDVEFIASAGHAASSLAGFDALIPGMAYVTETLLNTADRLQLIQQAGAGLERVDLQAARQRGIAVANVPSDSSGNADSVAELGIWMMLGLARRSHEIAAAIAGGQLGIPVGMALKGKTVGLVGLGGIGKALSRRLAGFEMQLIGVKRRADQQFARDHGLAWLGTMDQLPELLAAADFVILSLPDNAETHHIIDETALAQMKTGSFLINLGRGGLIDKTPFLAALEVGHLAGAGLDVFWQEPVAADDELFQYNIIATPHLGGVTDISLAGNVKGVCDNLRRLRDGEAVQHRWV